MKFKLTNNGQSAYGVREDGNTVSYTIEAEEYKQWLANGNIPEPEFTEAELEAQVKQLAKVEKTEALSKLTVTTSTGKVFYADTESRVDLNDAIRRAEKENLSNTPWKLAENFEGERVVIVTLEEIREAADLALSAKGSIVGVIQIKEGE